MWWEAIAKLFQPFQTQNDCQQLIQSALSWHIFSQYMRSSWNQGWIRKAIHHWCTIIYRFYDFLLCVLSSSIPICNSIHSSFDCPNFITALEGIRSDSQHDKFYEIAVNTAAKIEVEPSKPRTRSRQAHCGNVLTNSFRQYYKVIFFYHFVDHILSHMKSRFPPELDNAMHGGIFNTKAPDWLDWWDIREYV